MSTTNGYWLATLLVGSLSWACGAQQKNETLVQSMGRHQSADATVQPADQCYEVGATSDAVVVGVNEEDALIQPLVEAPPPSLESAKTGSQGLVRCFDQ